MLTSWPSLSFPAATSSGEEQRSIPFLSSRPTAALSFLPSRPATTPRQRNSILGPERSRLPHAFGKRAQPMPWCGANRTAYALDFTATADASFLRQPARRRPGRPFAGQFHGPPCACERRTSFLAFRHPFAWSETSPQKSARLLQAACKSIWIISKRRQPPYGRRSRHIWHRPLPGAHRKRAGAGGASPSTLASAR